MARCHLHTFICWKSKNSRDLATSTAVFCWCFGHSYGNPYEDMNRTSKSAGVGEEIEPRETGCLPVTNNQQSPAFCRGTTRSTWISTVRKARAQATRSTSRSTWVLARVAMSNTCHWLGTDLETFCMGQFMIYWWTWCMYNFFLAKPCEFGLPPPPIGSLWYFLESGKPKN